MDANVWECSSVCNLINFLSLSTFHWEALLGNGFLIVWEYRVELYFIFVKCRALGAECSCQMLRVPSNGKNSCHVALKALNVDSHFEIPQRSCRWKASKKNSQRRYALYATNPFHGVRNGATPGTVCYTAATAADSRLKKSGPTKKNDKIKQEDPTSSFRRPTECLSFLVHGG